MIQRAGLLPTFDLMYMYSRLHPRNGFYQILVNYICLFLFALSSILSSIVLCKLYYLLLSIASAKKIMELLVIIDWASIVFHSTSSFKSLNLKILRRLNILYYYISKLHYLPFIFKYCRHIFLTMRNCLKIISLLTVTNYWYVF